MLRIKDYIGQRFRDPAQRYAGTCSPGSWRAGGAGAGWNQLGPTASPPTGAVTATPAPPRAAPDS